MSTGAQYVVAAYGVVLFGLLMYVVVLGLRTARLAREAELLARLIEREDDDVHQQPEQHHAVGRDHVLGARAHEPPRRAAAPPRAR